MRNKTVKAGDAAANGNGVESRPQPIVMLVDGDRRLCDIGGDANALLKEGSILSSSFGRLSAPRQSDLTRIDRALTEARSCGAATLSLGQGEIEANVVRMGADPSRPHYLILARRRPDYDRQRGYETARRFGLTSAENRLLGHLLQGTPLKEAACRLGVARTTARSHLQRIFDKTGVRRQTELHRMIAYEASAGAF